MVYLSNTSGESEIREFTDQLRRLYKDNVIARFADAYPDNNWADGYKEGYLTALRDLLIDVTEFEPGITLHEVLAQQIIEVQQ
jgi:hypothetical protein